MRTRSCLIVLVLLAALPAFAQQTAPTRDQTRELVRASLTRYGAMPDVNVTFRQSDQQPYNFVGIMSTGLKNAQTFEIVVSVSDKTTMHVRVYPHYNGGYVNLDKATNSAGLMRKMLLLTDNNFLFWGADKSGDIFAGYTITLESGYPEEAVSVVMRSIRNCDQFVGEMRPFIDGSNPAP